MSSPLGPMAPLIINNDAFQGETFLPGQIFVFGGFALRTNSLGHLEQIESYAPGHQVRFGSLHYTADRSSTDSSHSQACRTASMGMI